ncbi:MAG: hypothetical protein ABF751_11505, partial [Acetobacter orientalis]|uniref:hypothetical protein n=1 Tax=Acetobacter orientalis TaxID=146474 RepID=UPI0039EAF8B4
KLYNNFISNVKYNLSLFYVKYHFFLPCSKKRYLTYVGENPVFVIFADDLNYDQSKKSATHVGTQMRVKKWKKRQLSL